MAKFRTRARAVDMLGRQQIAGAPSAIGELFKNAYDAYADNAEVDYFRVDNLLVIRDDGIGMTKDEFENRWLVLGTENKLVGQEQTPQSVRPAGKTARPIMGEKGIGRLAIALLGKQVLVLTRANRAGNLDDLVMCFIHWGLFEVPGLNLDEVEIPISTISGGRLPSAKDVSKLVAEGRAIVEGLKQKIPKDTYREIMVDMKDIQIDPEDLDRFLIGPSLKNSGQGTHFFILPTNETILAEIEGERVADRKDFTKFLLGFCNSTFVDTSSPPIKTAFRYWPTDDADPDDLISDGEFFTAQEIQAADHRIRGEIDEFGQFRGTVRVYEQEYVDHVISWKESDGKPTACGPFSIEFGYLQGAQRESRLDADDWARLNAKLINIGGLYVYRDRIRILPYGNSDVDWIEVELRRNKGLGHYFFAYRRIFGAVCITKGDF